jgi:S-adenosylmethionine/arginine decarboxylase-like enzyme
MNFFKRRQIEKNDYWGLLSSINLYDCDADSIRDADYIKEFIVKLCDLIKMKRFGETTVVDFGDDPRVTGFSMTQLIETSLISAHFVNQINAVYLDVFSCSKYNPEIVMEFAKHWFQAEKATISVTIRK